MGKNRIIKSLGNIIGNLVVHKVTLKYGDKLEARHKTSLEIVAYRDNAISVGEEFNWNDSDKIEIRKKVLKYFLSKMEIKYPHIKFPMDAAKEIIDKTIGEVLP